MERSYADLLQSAPMDAASPDRAGRADSIPDHAQRVAYDKSIDDAEVPTQQRQPWKKLDALRCPAPEWSSTSAARFVGDNVRVREEYDSTK